MIKIYILKQKWGIEALDFIYKGNVWIVECFYYYYFVVICPHTYNGFAGHVPWELTCLLREMNVIGVGLLIVMCMTCAKYLI